MWKRKIRSKSIIYTVAYAMNLTTRSLLLSLLACFSMALFAQSPQFSGGQSWITIVFLVATFALSGAGIWLGWRGAQEQRTLRAWLAPGINAFIIVVFLAFLLLLWWGLSRLQ